MIHALSFSETPLIPYSIIHGMWMELQVVPLLGMFLPKSNRQKWLFPREKDNS